MSAQPADHCPHCDYPLDGLPSGTPRCPECGGDLSRAGYAKAAARRMVRDARARMALLLSPLIGIALLFPALIGRIGGFLALALFVLTLWTGAAIAIYTIDRRRDQPRRLRRAILLGLPIGIGYFAALVIAALLTILIILVFGAITRQLG